MFVCKLLQYSSVVFLYKCSFVVLIVCGRSFPATKWRATKCPRDKWLVTKCPRDEMAGDELYPRKNGRRRKCRRPKGGDETTATKWWRRKGVYPSQVVEPVVEIRGE